MYIYDASQGSTWLGSLTIGKCKEMTKRQELGVKSADWILREKLLMTPNISNCDKFGDKSW